MYSATGEGGVQLPQQMPQSGTVYIGVGGKDAQFAYALPKISSSQERDLKKARKYAAEQTTKVTMQQKSLEQKQQLQKQQAMSMMQRSLEQVWIKLGTIYVGSINFDITEDVVKQAFLPFGPMKSISLGYDHLANKHKGYSFIEYEIPEAAFLAMEQMNNVMLGGRNIKVGRPSNMPQCQPVIERLREEASKYHRVYVTSIHPDLTENDLRTVFEAFGKILSIQLAPDVFRPGRHKGYAFIEYDKPYSAHEAVTNMNLFDLGGQYLRCGKAVTPPNLPHMVNPPSAPMPSAAAAAAAAVSAQLNKLDASSMPTASAAAPPAVTMPRLGLTVGNLAMAATTILPQMAAAGLNPLGLDPSQSMIDRRTGAEDDNEPLERQENMAIKGSQARNVMMQKLMRRAESRVMLLRNMVGPEDLDEDLESEVTDECSKYGEVEKVIIYQERQSEADDAEVHVKIFVLFHATSSAERAIQSLNNRYFAGRRVSAVLYEQSMYDCGDLSG